MKDTVFTTSHMKAQIALDLHVWKTHVFTPSYVTL